MKVTVRDFEIFNSLDVNVIIAYLQRNGWHEHSRIYDNKGAIWVKKNDAGDVFDIGLPLTREFADYPARKVVMMGFVVGKLQKIYLELKENDFNLALKAYQERIPVTCGGDFVKDGGYFVVKNLREFALMAEEAKGDEIAIAVI